jgi:hypothetical protein
MSNRMERLLFKDVKVIATEQERKQALESHKALNIWFLLP